MCRDFSNFLCLDDKHKIKVGEPQYPVAAVDRGRRVIVSSNERMVVADHDFTKFSVIPLRLRFQRVLVVTGIVVRCTLALKISF